MSPDSAGPQTIRPIGTRDYSRALFSAAFAPLILGAVVVVVTVLLEPASAPIFLLGRGLVIFQILLFLSGFINMVMGILLLRQSYWVRSFVERGAHPSERGALAIGGGLAVCLMAATMSFRPPSPFEYLLLVIGLPTCSLIALVIARRVLRMRRPGI